MRGLILRDDRRGDAAALADLVAALLGPGPDFRTALTAGPAPGAAAAATGGAGTARVLCVLSERLAQFLGVRRTKPSPSPRPRRHVEGHTRPSPLSSVPWEPALPLEHLFIGCQTYTRVFCLTIRLPRVSLTSSPRASQADTKREMDVTLSNHVLDGCHQSADALWHSCAEYLRVLFCLTRL